MSDVSTPGGPAAPRYPAASRQKVPPFARYEGTSAWKKDRRRAREYARYLAATARKQPVAATPSA